MKLIAAWSGVVTMVSSCWSHLWKHLFVAPRGCPTTPACRTGSQATHLQTEAAQPGRGFFVTVIIVGWPWASLFLSPPPLFFFLLFHVGKSKWFSLLESHKGLLSNLLQKFINITRNMLCDGLLTCQIANEKKCCTLSEKKCFSHFCHEVLQERKQCTLFSFSVSKSQSCSSRIRTRVNKFTTRGNFLLLAHLASIFLCLRIEPHSFLSALSEPRCFLSAFHTLSNFSSNSGDWVNEFEQGQNSYYMYRLWN